MGRITRIDEDVVHPPAEVVAAVTTDLEGSQTRQELRTFARSRLALVYAVDLKVGIAWPAVRDTHVLIVVAVPGLV